MTNPPQREFDGAAGSRIERSAAAPSFDAGKVIAILNEIRECRKKEDPVSNNELIAIHNLFQFIESAIKAAEREAVIKAMDRIEIEFVEQKGKFDQGFNLCALEVQTRIHDIKKEFLGREGGEKKG